MAEILDGKLVSSKIREKIRGAVDAILQTGKIVPGLAVVIVGENPASALYVSGKRKACREVGFASIEVQLPATIPQSELLEEINKLNQDRAIHGILVQLPLPSHLDSQIVVEAISPVKDVDGFHPLNLGKLMTNEECLIPCTPLGVMELLRHYKIPLAGRKAVMVGRSNIVGKPLAMLLLRENATVTIAHSKTADLPAEVKNADIVIAATGKPRFIPGDWIKEGAVVVDVGINYIPDPTAPNGTKLVGDVFYEGVFPRASFITPVPGGVGPMTNAMLLANTLKARQTILGSS
jgi:methylenetetrahydrofolate dehydrogenase (NADP+)/methenyltetrahydrofolate cyclohydrolase